MNPDLQRMIKQAEGLRRKPRFPMSLFAEADYVGSGELYCEAARLCEGTEDRIGLYKEAAATFLMTKTEYGLYRASECYKKLFDILEGTDPEQAVGYYVLHAECQEKAEKYLMAGQAYMKIGEIVKSTDKRRAVCIYRKAYETYRRDASCPYHAKEALQKCLDLELRLGMLEDAIRSFDALDTKHSKLSKQILCFLQGREDFEEDLDREESAVMMALLNREKDECIEVLESFQRDNYLSESTQRVFDIALEHLRPENDIC